MDRYVPALRFHFLTPAYDRVVRLTTRETEFKRRLLNGARLQEGERVLDLGCGTGTLAIAAKLRQPDAEIVGIDGDPEIIERARLKAATERADVVFDHGLSTNLPYSDRSFDVVLSTLLFHHLTPTAKRQSAAEIARVLMPSGRLWVADWGRPQDPLMAVLFLGVRLLDGFESTRQNAAGTLPSIFADAGLTQIRQHERLRTMLGSIALHEARSGADGAPPQ
ncbi:MAG: methyltransferase domain-containing protein [Solirubrobacterales bacterium]